MHARTYARGRACTVATAMCEQQAPMRARFWKWTSLGAIQAACAACGIAFAWPCCVCALPRAPRRIPAVCGSTWGVEPRGSGLAARVYYHLTCAPLAACLCMARVWQDCPFIFRTVAPEGHTARAPSAPPPAALRPLGRLGRAVRRGGLVKASFGEQGDDASGPRLCHDLHLS